MSKENKQQGNTWGEEETLPTFRDAYLNAVNQNQSQPHSNDAPQEKPPETPSRPKTRSLPRGVPGSARVYEESDEQPVQDPRTTRQAHDEALARLRPRPRQPIASHEQAEERARPAQKSGRVTPRQEQPEEYPSRPARSRREPVDTYPYQQSAPRTPRPSRARARSREDEQYDDNETVQPRHSQSAQASHRRKRGGGRALSNILTGCLGGLLTIAVLVALGAFYLLHNTPLGQNFGKTAYTQQINQPIALGNATMLIVKNQVGNVSINVDANTSSSSLASVEKVQANSQSEANNQFSKMILTTKQISQGADPACTASSCFLITATVPMSSSGGFFGGGNSSAIDLTLTLPGSFNSPDPTAPYTLNASSTSGDLTINGFNGILNLTGNSGNISVSNAIIFANTCLQTMNGDINVGKNSHFDIMQPSNLNPCYSTPGKGDQDWYHISSGKGNINITLPSTNLKLNTSTDNGKITDDFNLNIINNNDGSASYIGPLLLNSNPKASLYVSTVTGNIGIRKG